MKCRTSSHSCVVLGVGHFVSGGVTTYKAWLSHVIQQHRQETVVINTSGGGVKVFETYTAGVRDREHVCGHPCD